MEMDPTFDISPVGAASRGFGTVPFFSDSPRTNGMVKRFNGRIGAEVLAITIYSHDQLEQLLRGFNAAYNARRQRVLEAKTPDQVVAERLTAKPALAKDKPSVRAGPCDIIKARLIAENAKEVSQPDTLGISEALLRHLYRHGLALTGTRPPGPTTQDAPTRRGPTVR